MTITPTGTAARFGVPGTSSVDIEPVVRAATFTARAGVGSDPAYGAVMPPLYLSSNYLFDDIGRPGPYDYTRSGNPTRSLLAAAIAELEGGAGAVVTSSGMSAITVVLHHLAAGSRLVVAHDCYGGMDRLLRALSARGALEVHFADLTDLGSATRLVHEVRPDAIWIETPSNPLLRITDIRGLSATAAEVGAVTIVDNTFLSPALQRPLALGADIVVHSTTKFLNGHSDVVGGAIVAYCSNRSQDLAWWANCLGVTGAPFDSYMTLRGLRTLWARVDRHGVGTEAVVGALRTHPAVGRLYYPGLSDHPGHEVAAVQQSGFGSMVAFELEGGVEAARAFAAGLRHFSLAESLGGVESLVCHPATMTHAAMDPQARTEAGITDRLLRISVGIEDPADLAADVLASLDRLEDPCPAL